jgi:hypothetical protein
MKAKLLLLLFGFLAAATNESRSTTLDGISTGNGCLEALQSFSDRLDQLEQRAKQFRHACAQPKSNAKDTEALAAEREKTKELRQTISKDEGQISELESTIDNLKLKNVENIAIEKDREDLRNQITDLRNNIANEEKHFQEGQAHGSGLLERLTSLTKPIVEKVFGNLAPCERVDVSVDPNGLIVVSGQLLDLDARKKGLSELFGGRDSDYVRFDQIEPRRSCLNAAGGDEWGAEFQKGGSLLNVQLQDIKDVDSLPPASACSKIGQQIDKNRGAYFDSELFWVFDPTDQETVYCHKTRSGWSTSSVNRSTKFGLIFRKND